MKARLAGLMRRYLDDSLVLAGCLCILIGLAMISPVITWIAAGVMLILFGFMVGKAKANADQ